tara:strand:- start:2027 stop:3994 length:1968 start_codon:yes stop_codon:yes gene_type:complete
MTRARELAKLANSSVFNVDSSNNVGINSSTPDAKLDVVGVVSATQYFGDGSNLTGIVAGATLNASSGTQRLVVTSQTSGSMTQAATNADIAYNTSTNTLSATNFSGTLLGNATGLQGTPSITVQDVAAEKVSIAGTISYEDVTNVNSVGIITANKGIKVPNYGMTVTGVVTATSYQGDGSSLTGVESGVSNFVASGTIPNGSTVVIKTDGTATVIGQTGSASPTVGSPVQYSNIAAWDQSSIYDPDTGKIIIAYRDQANSGYGRYIVGTVSGTSISFGSVGTFYSSSMKYPSLSYDTLNNKVVMLFEEADSNNVKARVGTVSGTSISFGSPVEFSTYGAYISNTYIGGGKIVVSYSSQSYAYGRARVGTISGTSISFGNEVNFNVAATNSISSIYDPINDKLVVAYRDGDNSGNGTAIIGTVSGTNISFGSEVVFSTTNTYPQSIVYDPTTQKIVIPYRDVGDNDYGKAVVGTVSGTSISFGSKTTFRSSYTNKISAIYDPVKEKVVILYKGSSDYPTAIVGTVSGTSISFGTAVVIDNVNGQYTSIAYDSTNEKVVMTYNDYNNNKGKTVVFVTNSIITNLTAENYIGLAAEAIANGATGKITTIGGINSGQTGLTTAQTYYVQTDGSLATSAGNPSVVAGTAVSNTKVLVWKS